MVAGLHVPCAGSYTGALSAFVSTMHLLQGSWDHFHFISMKTGTQAELPAQVHRVSKCGAGMGMETAGNTAPFPERLCLYSLAILTSLLTVTLLIPRSSRSKADSASV